MRKTALILSLLGLYCLLYTHLHLRPLSQRPDGYATYYTYYTMADITWRTPAAAHRVHDRAWFQARMERLSFTYQDIYGANPPTTGFLLGPLLLLPPAAGGAVWQALNLAALVAGSAMLLAALNVSWHQLVWLLPLLSVTGPVLHHFQWGQIYLLLFLGLAVIYWSVLRGRPRWAGVVLGLMLAAKTAGAWLLLLFLGQRRRRLVVAALVTGGVIAGAALWWLGPAAWLAYGAMLLDVGEGPGRLVTAYQTTASLWGQLFIQDSQWNPTPALHRPALANGLTLVTLGGSLFLSWRTGRLHEGGPVEKALSLALFNSLMVSNAPLAEEYHYVLLIPAAVVAVWHAGRVRPTLWTWAWLLGALLLLALPLPYEQPQLSDGWWALLAFPRVYGAYLLWGWLAWCLKKRAQLPSG